MLRKKYLFTLPVIVALSTSLMAEVTIIKPKTPSTDQKVESQEKKDR